MKILKIVLLGALGVYIGLQLVWYPPHPARLSVNEIRNEIIHFYDTHGTIPFSLDFIEDKGIRTDIERYSISWHPNELEIKSEGNRRYEADFIYLVSMGTLGNRVKREFKDPGHILTNTIPEGTKVEPGGAGNEDHHGGF